MLYLVLDRGCQLTRQRHKTTRSTRDFLFLTPAGAWAHHVVYRLDAGLPRPDAAAHVIVGAEPESLPEAGPLPLMLDWASAVDPQGLDTEIAHERTSGTTQAAAQAALRDLLSRMFSVEEVRRLIRYLPGGEEMTRELPSAPASPRETVAAVVAVLVGHRRVDDALFNRLVAERSRREKEIREVQSLFETAQA